MLRYVLRPPIEPGMPVPRILIVAPPPIQTPKGPIAAKFRCDFLDAGPVTMSSRVDGVHLDADQQQTLGRALRALAGVARGLTR